MFSTVAVVFADLLVTRVLDTYRYRYSYSHRYRYRIVPFSKAGSLSYENVDNIIAVPAGLPVAH